MLAHFSRGHDVIIVESDLILHQNVRLGFFGNSLPPLLWVSWLTDLICGSLLYPLDYDYELNSVWYFYYSTSFLFFSMITFTTELKLAPQDVWLFTFTFTPEHSRADLGMRHKKNWLFVHCYRNLVLQATRQCYKVVLQGGATRWCYEVVLQGGATSLCYK